MTCPRCRSENEADATFCTRCGARLERVCLNCQTPNGSDARFCKRCGQALAAAESPRAEPPAPFASPQAYTPKHLAEKILTSKAALEGERKQVTVLFADLKGSMELLADRDPEEARKLLDPVLERMMEAVHRYEGTVNQVMGDGIMALFGAPLAHEDHAVRACYAALRMQESVREYAERVRRDEGVSIQIRVGVNSGDVVVRTIGSELWHRRCAGATRSGERLTALLAELVLRRIVGSALRACHDQLGAALGTELRVRRGVGILDWTPGTAHAGPPSESGRQSKSGGSTVALGGTGVKDERERD